MNWVDIIVGVFMILFLVAGTRRGFIREVTGFVGLVIALALGIGGAHFWADIIVEELHFPHTVATVVSFGLIFALVFLLFRGIGSLLFKFVHLSPLSWLDRVGGSIFGLLKSGMIISVILLILGVFSLPPALSKPLGSSALVPPLRAFAPAAYNLFKAAFPQMRSLSEIAGRSVERGFTRGKEQVLKKGSRVVDMLQREKVGQEEKTDRQGDSEPNETSSKE